MADYLLLRARQTINLVIPSPIRQHRRIGVHPVSLAFEPFQVLRSDSLFHPEGTISEHRTGVKAGNKAPSVLESSAGIAGETRKPCRTQCANRSFD